MIFEECLQGINEVQIKNNILSKLIQLDKSFELMSGKVNKELWSNNALRNSREWEDKRREAREILKSMELDYSEPNIYWNKYVK